MGCILVVQSTFPNKLLVFGWWYTFLGIDWSTSHQALSSFLKFKLEVPIWEYSWNIHIHSFTHKYQLLNTKLMLFPNNMHILIHRLHINHQKCWIGGHPALGCRRYGKCIFKLQIWFSNWNLIFGQKFQNLKNLINKYKLFYGFIFVYILHF